MVSTLVDDFARFTTPAAFIAALLFAAVVCYVKSSNLDTIAVNETKTTKH